jgi:hypothetical protein
VILVNPESGKEVAVVVGDELRFGDGKRYLIDGYAVVDVDGIIGDKDSKVGTFDDNSFRNRDGKLEAVAKVDNQ